MSQSHLRMLSIDEQMVTTDLDRAGYRKMGVEVRSARSFEEAKKIIEKEPIDIIVINMDYKKVNAPLVCQHFKNEKTDTPRPVVLTSVLNNASMRNNALNSGADLFVVQPVPRQHFIEKLKQLLAQQTRGQERVRVNGEAELIVEGKTHSLPVGDLSTTGVLVGSSFELTIGTNVDIAFEVPGYRKPIEAAGEVVRVLKDALNGAPEFKIALGIKFATFKGDSQKRLEKYVEKSSHQNAKMIYYL